MFDTIQVNVKTQDCPKTKKNLKKSSKSEVGFGLETAFMVPFVKQINVVALHQILLKKIN